MSVLLVDWLGRGGIAQCTEAWAIELDRLGEDVHVVTRPDRELGAGFVRVHAAAHATGRVAAHRAVVRAAVDAIDAQQPSCVVIQNYVLPPLERAVHRAAQQVGARVVVVVHDDRLHTWRAGTGVGLGPLLRAADAVVAHTQFVADAVAAASGRHDVCVVDHPVQVGMLAWPRVGPPAPSTAPAALVAGHFGVLRRGYKGTSVVERLARPGVDGWRFLLAGTGARAVPGAVTMSGYLDPGALVAAVEGTHATLLPYRRATQSGAVVLAQALESVPVASAVGGLPEQIDDGVDGVLVAPGTPPEGWARVLADLADDDHRKALAAAGHARVWRQHDHFVRAIEGLVA
jgi:glycosyltransferase involved in cell wall biosynthesis